MRQLYGDQKIKLSDLRGGTGIFMSSVAARSSSSVAAVRDRGTKEKHICCQCCVPGLAEASYRGGYFLADPKNCVHLRSSAVSDSCKFRQTARAAFSLIELLCAMAILIVVVLMMSIIFTESDRSWTLGTNRVENNAAGRATLDMIAHDLQYAVADDVLTFKMGKDRLSPQSDSYSFVNSEICMVSLENNSSTLGERTACEVHYYVCPMTNGPYRYQIQRAYYSSEITGSNYKNHCYWNSNWWADVSASPAGAGRPTNGQMIAENVVGLGFYYKNGQTAYYSGPDTAYGGDPANSNRMPEYVDIWIEVLNERPAMQASQLWISKPNLAKEIVEQNVRRYTERVYLHDRHGYSNR